MGRARPLGSSSPTSRTRQLRDAIRDGRYAEFADARLARHDPSVPDPNDEQTFLRSKLDWSEPAKEPHATLLRHLPAS